MPISKKRNKKRMKAKAKQVSSRGRADAPVSKGGGNGAGGEVFELQDDDVIHVRGGRRRGSSVVVPGPGNRAGLSDGEVTYMPKAMIFDSRLGPHAVATYGRLLVERPPFRGTWEEVTAFVLDWDRHLDDTEADTVEGLEQLRTHGYLVPCEGGWTLDVPDDAEANAYDWSEE